VSDTEGSWSDQIPECPHVTGHKWETVGVEIEGRGSFQTCTIEQCSLCDGLRLNFEPELLGEVGRD